MLRLQARACAKIWPKGPKKLLKTTTVPRQPSPPRPESAKPRNADKAPPQPVPLPAPTSQLSRKSSKPRRPGYMNIRRPHRKLRDEYDSLYGPSISNAVRPDGLAPDEVASRSSSLGSKADQFFDRVFHAVMMPNEKQKRVSVVVSEDPRFGEYLNAISPYAAVMAEVRDRNVLHETSLDLGEASLVVDNTLAYSGCATETESEKDAQGYTVVDPYIRRGHGIPENRLLSLSLSDSKMRALAECDVHTLTTEQRKEVVHGLTNDILSALGLPAERIESYATLIAASARSGELTTATLIYQMAIQLGFTEVRALLSSLLNGHAVNGKMREAMSLLEEMKRQGYVPDVAVWNSIMFGFLFIKDYANVWKCFDGMKRYASIDPVHSTFHILLKACRRQSLVEKGMALFQEMEHVYKIPPTEDTFRHMMRLYATRPGFSRELSETFERMGVHGYRRTAGDYGILLSGYAVDGDIVKIRRTLRTMSSNGYSLHRGTVNEVLRGYARAMHPSSQYRAQCKEAGKVFEAAKLARECDELMGALRGLKITPDSRTINHLFQIKAYVMSKEEAEDFFERGFTEYGVKKTSASYTILAEVYASSQDTTSMETLFDSMMNQNIEPEQRFVHIIIMTYFRKGTRENIEKGITWLQVMQSRGYTASPNMLDRFISIVKKSEFIRDMGKREIVDRIQAGRRNEINEEILIERRHQEITDYHTAGNAEAQRKYTEQHSVREPPRRTKWMWEHDEAKKFVEKEARKATSTE